MRLRSLTLAVAVLVATAFAIHRHRRPTALRVIDPVRQIPADGRFHRAGTLTPARDETVSVYGLRSQIAGIQNNRAELFLQSPVLPSERDLRIVYGASAARLHVQFTPSFTDSIGNGTPDFLRLHTADDRNAFRGWFTAMAGAAADLPSAKLPHEINDCAALLRWCYRNALHAHDETWLHEAPAGLDLTQPSVRQYVYPLTPLGAALFRTREGAFTADDLHNGAFAQFADVRTLWHLNTFFLGRDVRSARPGDLLFFRQLEQNSPYHSMILTTSAEGQSVIYHTGPIGSGPGEMRRVSLADLLAHPDPRWRPISHNTNFLGVYRWNILDEDPR